jgi:glycosyltransferase involved in cell wall biosynthesis
MRILQLGKYWRQDGGIETHVKNLCKGLASQGVDIVNLVSSLDQSTSDFHVDRYRVVAVPTLGILASTSIAPVMVLTARRLHAQKPFDLIHLHFPDPMAHLVSMTMPAKIPRVITWHSDIVRQKRLLTLYRPWQIREIRRAEAVVASTRSHFRTSEQLPTDYPAERRHVIPFGFDYAWLCKTPATQHHIESIRARAGRRFIVFALGRHVSYKGFDVLINAIAQTDAFLILGGDGPLHETLRALAARGGILERVWFTGRLDADAVSACYHACDVFCMPSVTRAETFGIVQLEAMACGKPVICTDLGNGVNEVNGDYRTGITVPVGDALALASEITRLSQDPARCESVGTAARERSEKLFSINAMQSAHIALYHRLMTERDHRPGRS